MHQQPKSRKSLNNVLYIHICMHACVCVMFKDDNHLVFYQPIFFHTQITP